MRIIFVGDIVGRTGRRALARVLPGLKEERKPDLVIVNLENVAGGFGFTERALTDLEKAGGQFFTSGNHVWDKKEGVDLLDRRKNIIRPANYPSNAPGHGYRVIDVGGTPVGIFNIQGRVFMPPIDCPFKTIDALLDITGRECRVRIVDMHAEATSEKLAMGWHLDGRVSLVLGTHTHVPTKDARILPGGTGYVTDVGMTGANDSVLGVTKEVALRRLREVRPFRFEVARGDPRADIVIADIDEETGKTVELEHIQLKAEA